MNYKAQVTPKTAKFSHGGHVHNLLNKAYQHHQFGRRVMHGVYDTVKWGGSAILNEAIKQGFKEAGKNVAEKTESGVKNYIYPQDNKDDENNKQVAIKSEAGITPYSNSQESDKKSPAKGIFEQAGDYVEKKGKNLPEILHPGVNIASKTIKNIPGLAGTYAIKKAIDIAGHGLGHLANELVYRHMPYNEMANRRQNNN